MRRAPTNRMIAPGALAERAGSGAGNEGMGRGYAVSVAEFADWLTGEGPPVLVYAQGFDLPRDQPVVAAARDAADAGRVSLTRRVAIDGGSAMRWMHFRAERVAAAGGGDAGPMRARHGATDAAVEAVLAYVRRKARASLPGPTNDEIARACGLKNHEAARYILQKLTADGLIRIESGSKSERRIFIILTGDARGARTTGGAI